MILEIRRSALLSLSALLGVAALFGSPARADGQKIKIKTSLHALAAVAREVAGEAADVEALVRPNDNPEEITATPQLIVGLRDADVFIENGIGLESWSEKSIEESKNERIQKKAKGYCCATEGVAAIDAPEPGAPVGKGEHALGNPHTWLDPLMGRTFARNIEACLGRVSPDKVDAWERNREEFEKKLYDAVFGKELVEVVGGERLEKLLRQGKLEDYLQKNKYHEKPLVNVLGGLMKKARPLRGLKLISYHESVAYLARFYGCEVPAALEPKAGVAPTPGHLEEVARTAAKVGAKAVVMCSCEPRKVTDDFAQGQKLRVAILPADVGTEDTKDWFDFHEKVLDRLLEAIQ